MSNLISRLLSRRPQNEQKEARGRDEFIRAVDAETITEADAILTEILHCEITSPM